MNMTLKNITAVIRLAACAGCITIVCLFIAAPAGHAQQPKGTKVPAGSSEPSSPERTAASFGDWILRCEAPVAAQVRRVCEVAQVISAQGQNTPIAQVAIGRPAPMESSRLTVVLPANVTIPSKPQIAIAKGGTPIDLAWQSCVPGGCLASATVSDEAVHLFSAQGEPGRIVFKDAAGRDVALQLSFRGLAQALAALAKET
jgi:invasion protein IalB